MTKITPVKKKNLTKQANEFPIPEITQSPRKNAQCFSERAAGQQDDSYYQS